MTSLFNYLFFYLKKKYIFLKIDNFFNTFFKNARRANFINFHPDWKARDGKENEGKQGQTFTNVK